MNAHIPRPTPPAPLLLEIAPFGQVEPIGLRSRKMVIGYHQDDDRRHALAAIIASLETFAEDPTNLSLVCGTLDSHGQNLSMIAGDVATIRALECALDSRDLTEAEDAALHQLRSQTENPWIRARAGALLVLAQSPLRDQPAVCDASGVVG